MLSRIIEWSLRNQFLVVVAAVAVVAAEGEDPVAKLRKIEIYAFGGVGIGGTTSEGENLYRKVYARKSAKADFISIADKGTIEAKMYALHALARISPGEYEDRKETLDLDQKVTCMSGCIVFEQPVKAVLAQIPEANDGKTGGPKDRETGRRSIHSP